MCPGCGEPLVSFELEGISSDHCVACGGTWLDASEIQEIVERAGGSTDRLLAALKTADEKVDGSRTCVRCRSKMRTVKMGALDFDRCPYGHGIWFDKGELGEVLKRDGGEVAGFLKELFKAELGA
jgi:Zn-finger nucleic acid-binding protein